MTSSYLKLSAFLTLALLQNTLFAAPFISVTDQAKVFVKPTNENAIHAFERGNHTQVKAAVRGRPTGFTADGLKLTVNAAAGVDIIHNSMGTVLRTLPYPQPNCKHYTPLLLNSPGAIQVCPTPNSIELFHTGSGKLLQRITKHFQGLSAVAFSDDNRSMNYIGQQQLFSYNLFTKKVVGSVAVQVREPLAPQAYIAGQYLVANATNGSKTYIINRSNGQVKSAAARAIGVNAAGAIIALANKQLQLINSNGNVVRSAALSGQVMADDVSKNKQHIALLLSTASGISAMSYNAASLAQSSRNNLAK